MTMNETQGLLARWYETHQRTLPWRSDPTPYNVWLSEIILQQTRVNQGFDYYLRFIKRWPTLPDLAQATEEEVLKMWQGLGYYSRARNMLACARQVMARHGGSFPKSLEELRALKGIGDYTAAAIASIAFDLPHAVVDGNVYRVLSRIYDIDTPINTSEGVRLFSQLADDFLDREHPGRHNQALMEFGALQCLPTNPNCHDCPIQAHCLAFSHQSQTMRPVKERAVKTRTRYFTYLVLKSIDNKTYLHKRTGNDIWKNLFDFPCIESDHALETDEILDDKLFKDLAADKDFSIQRISSKYTHKLTHQTIVATFVEIKIHSFLSPIQTKDILLAAENELWAYPIPKLIENYLTTTKTTI